MTGKAAVREPSSNVGYLRRVWLVARAVVRLAARASWLWALVYVAAIPLFAVIYASHGEGFRISGPDTAAVSHRDGLAAMLRQQVEMDFEHLPIDQPPTVYSAFGVRFSHVDGDLLYVSISLQQYRNNPTRIVGGTLTCYVDGSGASQRVGEPLDVLNLFCPTETVRVFGVQPGQIFRSRRPDAVGETALAGSVSSTPAIDSTYDLVLAEAQGGIGTGGTSFARMVYFSTMTITTVGYGDIVPLSTAMRTSAAFEAIAGILTIGLFLNSLALRISSPSATGARRLNTDRRD